MDEIKSVNKIRDSRAWSFRLRKLPDKKPNLTDDELRVGRALYYANRGISLGSIVFSRSPLNEQEKMRRPILFGVNFVPFGKNFYTQLTTSYHSTTRNHKINRLLLKNETRIWLKNLLNKNL